MKYIRSQNMLRKYKISTWQTTINTELKVMFTITLSFVHNFTYLPKIYNYSEIISQTLGFKKDLRVHLYQLSW